MPMRIGLSFGIAYFLVDALGESGDVFVRGCVIHMAHLSGIFRLVESLPNPCRNRAARSFALVTVGDAMTDFHQDCVRVKPRTAHNPAALQIE